MTRLADIACWVHRLSIVVLGGALLAASFAWACGAWDFTARASG